MTYLPDICTNDIDLYLFVGEFFAKICKYERNGENQAELETTVSKMQNWSNTWLFKWNVQKCKVMSYGWHADRMVVNGQSTALDYEDHIKD